MITSHIIKEDKIFLYFDYYFELGSFKPKEKKSVLNQIYDYLKNTKIELNGKRIMLMLGSTLVATLIYTGGILKLDSIEPPKETIVETTLVHQKDIVEVEKEQVAEPMAPEKEEIKVEQTIVKENKPTEKHELLHKTESSKNKIKKENNITEKQPIKEKEQMEEEKKENMVTIYRSNGTVLELEMEEYIVGVVASEMPASFNIEALKAQSVIARTYALGKLSRGEILTDTVSTQSYIDIEQMKNKWGSDYSKYYNKIVNAVNSTRGQYLSYNGEYIEAVYHSTSNGYTEDASNVWGKSFPYLKSVESIWDRSTSSYLKIIEKDFETILNILGVSGNEISVISRNESGRVKEVKAGGKIYTGIEFRNLLGLRSADFDIEINDGTVTIITRGYGHGVGLSQYGANGMANAGYNYEQIINHYYSGVKLNK